MACRPETRELERRLRGRVDTLGPAPTAELPPELMLPDRAPRLDRGVLGLPGDSHLRRVADRLRRGPDPSDGARRGCVRPVAGTELDGKPHSIMERVRGSFRAGVR